MASGPGAGTRSSNPLAEACGLPGSAGPAAGASAVLKRRRMVRDRIYFMTQGALSFFHIALSTAPRVALVGGVAFASAA